MTNMPHKKHHFLFFSNIRSKKFFKAKKSKDKRFLFPMKAPEQFQSN